MSTKLKFGLGIALFFGLILSGCRSTSDWNPFVDISSYDVIVVTDFADQGNGAGSQLSDQVASELLRLGAYGDVRRSLIGSESIVVEGTIQRYVEGNVAARIKYGQAVGRASMLVEVRISADPGNEYIGSFTVTESTLMTGPDAGRTGREDIQWLQREVARSIASRLASAK